MWSESLKPLAYPNHRSVRMVLHAPKNRARHLLNLEMTSLCAMIQPLREIQNC